MCVQKSKLALTELRQLIYCTRYARKTAKICLSFAYGYAVPIARISEKFLFDPNIIIIHITVS